MVSKMGEEIVYRNDISRPDPQHDSLCAIISINGVCGLSGSRLRKIE